MCSSSSSSSSGLRTAGVRVISTAAGVRVWSIACKCAWSYNTNTKHALKLWSFMWAQPPALCHPKAGVWTNITGGKSVSESGVPIPSRPKDIGTSFKPGDVDLIHLRFCIPNIFVFVVSSYTSPDHFWYLVISLTSAVTAVQKLKSTLYCGNSNRPYITEQREYNFRYNV